MGIDAGGTGSTSGGYDHLGYSVLMNTRDEQLCPAHMVPTELSGQMEYNRPLTSSLIPSLTQEKIRKLVNGKVTYHNELGALVNNFSTTTSTLLSVGNTLRLIPQLPEGEEDTGLWQWNTGQQTREITVETGWSYVYHVTYTNKNNVKSQLAFFIATTDKGEPVGIKEVRNVKCEKSVDAVYDISGRRSSSMQKGHVYIVNGHKVLY